jgi:hypothetical protein
MTTGLVNQDFGKRIRHSKTPSGLVLYTNLGIQYTKGCPYDLAYIRYFEKRRSQSCNYMDFKVSNLALLQFIKG